MSWVPLKQTVTIHRSKGEDEYGRPLSPEIFELPCRVDEGAFLVEYRTSGNISSREVVAEARIIFDKLADIKYTDQIEYRNELDEIIKKPPQKISIKRHINTKPILTEVFV